MSSHAVAAGGPPRRDFLKLVTGAGAAIGTAAIAWTLIDSMEPAKDVIAAGAPIDLDITSIQPGQQVIIRWRGKPILVVNRTPEAMKTLQEAVAGQPAGRSGLLGAPAATLCGELAPLGTAGPAGAGRHLHPSGLPAVVLAEAGCHNAGTELAGRVFLSVPWLEIRSGGAGVCRRAGTVQPARAAVPFPHREDSANRRKPERADLQSVLYRADVGRPASNCNGWRRPTIHVFADGSMRCGMLSAAQNVFSTEQAQRATVGDRCW